LLSLDRNERGMGLRIMIEVAIARISGYARRNAIVHVVALPVVMLFLILSVRADAGEIEPRSFVNSPIGVNFLLAGYAFSEGDLSTPAASPLKDGQIKMNSTVLAYARVLNVGGNSGKVDMILPYSWLSGNAKVGGQLRERNIAGIHDPRFRFSVNFYGSPALSLKEFADYEQDLIIGASIQVAPPLGQYDKSKLVNIGTNRWFIKPEMGISKAWGPVALELSTGVIFFTNNDEFYGGKTLEQDPISTSQLHATYNFGHGIWAALSGTYDFGGRTTVGGVRSDDLQNNSRLGATLALPVNRNNSLKLYASSALHTTIGNDYKLAGIVWQYRWGSGL